MDASTLRWILIVIGVIIVGSIFLFGNPDKKRKPKASRRKPARPQAEASSRREPTLDADAAGASLDSAGAEDPPAGQGELDIDAPAARAPEKTPPRKPAGPPPDKIIGLFLLARDNHVITGAELLQAAVSTGMEFGDMNIFHRVAEGTERPIFSMANAAKPGHFERDEWNSFETTGVALFMALPGPLPALDAWDSMLATARRMAEILHAELLDDEHNPFTRQKEAQIRELTRTYDRGRGKSN
ncbi:MAG: cell division protein ZipA [Lysobacterales bacterium]